MLDYLLENGIKIILFWLVGFLALWIAVTTLGLNTAASFPSVDASKWQAVFLSNNQVYFGKLKNYDGTYVTLSDVYYLRTASDLDQSGTASLNLIKLGGELHGPEDPIFIPKSSVLFWENMKATSRVVETILGAQQ
jgi:hypothetical protein